MASLSSKIEMVFNIDPIVKLKCRKIGCFHNLHRLTSEIACNLKHIDLDEDGKCIYFKSIEEDNNKRGK